MTELRGRGQLRRSDELRAVTARHWAALRRGDVDAVITRLSMMDGVTWIGTDQSEYVDDPESLVRYTRQQFDALPVFPVGEAQIEAWSEDDFGWAVLRSTVEAATVRELRATIVYHLEHDEWKVVHAHFSIGAPNEEVFGTPLTFSLDQIVDVVENERPDIAAWVATDGTVTIVFTDIEGSTALNALFGDTGWIEVLRAHNEVVARQTTEHGGNVVQRIGDGFMLVFPAARRALRCAEAIEREIAATFNDPGSPIRVRVGIHTGEVIQQADEFFGQAVNYAARVVGAAAGGEILCSSLVHDLVSTDREFNFGASRDVVLKGIDGAQRLYPLTPRA
jgi:class 3 adenylate cyclase/ketosteroid isomerase-like protein